MNHLEIQRLLKRQASAADTIAKLRKSAATPAIMAVLRAESPDLAAIPRLTYTMYREFERNGLRQGYETPYFGRRAMLSRAVLEIALGDDSCIDAAHDLLMAICEETSWVLPAHEEQGPDYWELQPAFERTAPFGASTALNREPEAIDLFCAETGAALAEAIFLVGDRLAPEVVRRVRLEVERRIFRPYLAFARKHWWFTGPLNWNAVCNGAIAVSFLRLCADPALVAQALELALEGMETYLATGFEPDGGSIEGIGYWNYGLMYYVVLGEHLHFATEGAIDLLGDERLKKIARYPFAVATEPGKYLAFGDATTDLALEPGVVCRLAERTGTPELPGLLVPPQQLEAKGISKMRLAMVVGDMLWWDGRYHDFPQAVFRDCELPDCGIVKKVGRLDGAPILLTALAGHTDGHHSHTDVGSVVYSIGGENLIDDPGRALYWKGNFRKQRYDTLFNNSFGHSVPRIAGLLQKAGPEFGGSRQFHGTILGQGERRGGKYVELDFARAYDLPIRQARRSLDLDPASGLLEWLDSFAFDGADLPVEEAIVSWYPITVNGAVARIRGQRWTAELTIAEPAGLSWTVQEFAEEAKANQRAGVLRRLAVALPLGTNTFRMMVRPQALTDAASQSDNNTRGVQA